MTDIPRQPDVLIYGAGAVGTLLGGLLTQTGARVTLLGRKPALELIARRGLTIHLPDRTFRTHPETISTLAQAEKPFDIVLLSVRAFAVEPAIEVIPVVLAENGVLVSLQNGIGTEQLIAERAPDVRHLAGSLTLSANIPAPGVVESTSPTGGLTLAPLSDNAPVELVARLLRTGGLTVTTTADYRSMKWSKLLLNQMGNGIPAILGWTPGEVYRHPEVFRIEQAMLRETLRVIWADGSRLIGLPGFRVPMLQWVLRTPPSVARRLLLSRVEGGRGQKPPSLALDLQAGRSETESQWLYGAVAEAGRESGIATPVNRKVNAILKGIAINPALRDAFLNQPDRLIRNVALAVDDSR